MKVSPEFYFDGCVSCFISISEQENENTDGFYVNVKFKNETDYPILVDKRNLFIVKDNRPWIIEWAAFEVYLDGKKIRYHGVTFLRDGPHYPDDYYILHPDEEYIAKIDIANVYNISKKGEYSIKYFAFNAVLVPNKETFSYVIESNLIKFSK